MKRCCDQIKSLANELLVSLGNLQPSKKLIELMESLLSQVSINYSLSFDKRLTQREVTCLLLAALGKTSQQTAELLNVARATIETHRKAIKRKLSCDNLAHVVFLGVRYGYVNHVDISTIINKI